LIKNNITKISDLQGMTHEQFLNVEGLGEKSIEEIERLMKTIPNNNNMRHLKKKKIGKGRDHARKLVRSLAASAIVYEKIQTTEARAKIARQLVER
jgi:NAD-dependent DNA ligase